MSTDYGTQRTSVQPRFWNPHGAELQLLPDGFLLNPHDEFWRHSNPECVPLADLRDRECLVLLGEPGSGKSTSLDLERAELQGDSPDETVLYFNLAEYATDEAIRGGVFGNPSWQSWREDGNLTLFLDSYDECRLSLRTVANVLVREFRNLGDRGRLKLRIACRAGVWPAHLQQQLGELWPAVAVYDLAPLRWQDAEAILAELGVGDIEAFTRSVRDVDATPMLSSPLSLQMLADIYLQTGSVPPRRDQLFEQGCRALCTEQNQSRDAAGYTGLLNPDQRFQIAARIAALTMLCGRIGVWTGLEHERPADAPYLTIRDIRGGVESVSGVDFPVSDDVIRDVVGETRLFTPLGTDCFGWAHRTYAEFLAARYLLDHNIPIEQLRSMLCHPEMDRIVPQLRGVASWLGSRPDALQLIQETDAELLFSVDLTMHDASTRQTAVEAVLEAARRAELSDWGLSQSQYRRLAHPGIAAQVLPIIQDRTCGWLERRVAVDLAENCCITEAEGALRDLALDSTEDVNQRYNALAALSRSSNPLIVQDVRRLLESGLAEDVNDDMRGWCLRILWPDHIITAEALTHLTPAKRSNYGGSYLNLLEREFVDRIPAADLPIVLDWLQTLRGPSYRQDNVWCSSLRDQVLVRAWQENDTEEIQSRLGLAFWPKLTTTHQWDHRVRDYVEDLVKDPEKRRQLLLALFAAVPSLPTESDRIRPALEIAASEPKIVTEEDVAWLIERLDIEVDAPVRALVADLLSRFISGRSTSTTDQILIASERHPELRAEIAFAVEAVAIDSPEADRMREHYRETIDRERGRDEESHRINPPELIERSLETSEAGRHDFWILIADQLTLTQSSRHYGEVLRSDVTNQPGWESADQVTRQRIISAAHRYLLNEDPHTEAWIDDANVSGGDWAIAGVKALRLCRDASLETFESLPNSVWATWLPALLDFLANSLEEDTAKRELLAVAYTKIPETFLERVRQYLARENSRRNAGEEIRGDERIPFETTVPTPIPRQLSDCWDSRLADDIRAFAADASTNLTVRGNAVDELVRHGDQATIDSIIRCLGTGVPGEAEDRERARSDATSLILHDPESALSALQSIETSDPDFCRDVALVWASPQHFVDDESDSHLSDELLARYYLLLRRLFPPQDDPRIDGAHGYVPREMIGRKRDTLLQTLVSRATSQSVAQVRRIVDSVPDDLGMRLTLLDAERRLLHISWSPLEPSDVLAMVRDRQNRVVRSGQELINVLVESISRFEAELQGETPQNFSLWDKQPQANRDDPVIFRPKEEERLSDALRGHFERDLRGRGIVTNREVVIRPRQGTDGSPGERTDIQVDALSPGSRGQETEHIRAIVEVKGCWNREVNTAMADQLRDRYLADNDCRHGLYLVGWYICGQWDSGDYRRDDAVRLMPASLGDARIQFDQQAISESLNGTTLAAAVLNCSLR